MYLLNTHITNLPQYLNIFQSCVKHLINYQSIHIPTLKSPVILSRHEVIQTRPNFKRMLPYYFLRVNGSSPLIYKSKNFLTGPQLAREIKTREFALTITTQQRKWNCLTRFYIYPPKNWPQPDITEEYFTMVGEEKRRNMVDKIHFNCFPRLGYHILIPEPIDDSELEATIASWSYHFNRLLRRNEMLEMLVAKMGVYHEQNNSSGLVQIQITQLLICCRYCARFSPTFVGILNNDHQSMLTLGKIQHLIRTVNRNGFSVPIYVSKPRDVAWKYYDTES